jgi:hypothetical protein
MAQASAPASAAGATLAVAAGAHRVVLRASAAESQAHAERLARIAKQSPQGALWQRLEPDAELAAEPA